MSECPSCHRPVAVARDTCFYCRAPLPDRGSSGTDEEASVARPEISAPAANGVARAVLVLDLSGAEPETLARATGLSLFEAGLLTRRRGLHLHRVLETAAAEDEAARLTASGVPTLLVPEAEARQRPLRAQGGERHEQRLALRTRRGRLEIAPADLLLVVSGPIAREHRAAQGRRIARTRLDEGWRVQLHRVADPQPIEIDAEAFELGFSVAGSARLELESWIRAIGTVVPCDDGFRRLPVALGPADPETVGAVAAFSLLARAARERRGWRTRTGAPAASPAAEPMLDNVAQFRFYSGWLTAAERRRR